MAEKKSKSTDAESVEDAAEEAAAVDDAVEEAVAADAEEVADEVAAVEEAVEDVAAEEIAETVEAAAEVEAAVEEAVEAGELTPEEGDAIDAVVEEAAAEEVAAEVEAAAEVEEAVEEAAAEEVAEEAEAAAAVEEAVDEAAAAESGRKKKKRLPRALRPARTRPKRQPSAERKPIVRLPKPDAERGRRQERQGTVVSDKMDKTIVVSVDVLKAHPKYKKVVRRRVKFHAHDETNQAKIGDVVRIVETRPLSATKRWRLAEIVEAAK
jgi:small subunit ribosomal protein S17